MYVAPPCVAVQVDQPAGLRPHPFEQLRHDLRVRRDQVLVVHTADRAEDPFAHHVGGVVACATEPEGRGAERVMGELPGGGSILHATRRCRTRTPTSR